MDEEQYVELRSSGITWTQWFAFVFALAFIGYLVFAGVVLWEIRDSTNHIEQAVTP